MNAKKSLNLVVLISGHGGNLQAIIDAVEKNELDARILKVISNKVDAYGLERAKKHGISTSIIHFEKNMTREKYDQLLAQEIHQLNPDYIILAGFMRILSPWFISCFKNKILNIHPSLLPKYPGLNTHARVIEAGDKEHGCTVHLVTEELDAGPILGQMSLEVLPDDTPELLQKKVFELEHQLYPDVLRGLIRSKIC